MTREEAIMELNQFSGTTQLKLSANFWTALNMAIKTLEQEPCEDCVSRKAVINYIRTLSCDLSYWSVTDEVVKDIEALPPVTPTRKKGKWEFIGDNCFKCSECGEVYTVDQFNHINNYCNNKFPKACPNCGAEMEVEE